MIEAHHLFGVPYERIDVVVHPQSIVHSLVHLNDGASLAHLGYPDMRVPISYALHHPERADVAAPAPRPRRRRRAHLRGARPGDLPLPAPGPRGRRGRRHRALRAQRRRRGRRRGLPRRPDPLHRRSRGRRDHPRASAGAAPVTHFDDLYAADARGRASSPASSSHEARRTVSWVLAFAGFASLIILHEFGPLRRRQATGMRVEQFYLFFPPALIKRRSGRDRVRDRRDPARGLREDHRDEPRRGAAAGGGPARLLPPAGLEADRRDRRRAGGQHPDRVPDPLRPLLRGSQTCRTRSARSTQARPRPQQLQPGDEIVSVDGRSLQRPPAEERLLEFSDAVAAAQVPRPADRRLPRRRRR